MPIRKYLKNCFLLLVPILLWNILLVDYLPKAYSPDFFWKDIPGYIGITENILRIVVMGMPLIMLLSIKTATQKRGLLIYLIGVMLYFLSWIVMILIPESSWSQSAAGFMAPAYTTIIWFIGIALIGSASYFKISNLTFIYMGVSLLFVIFHTLHTYVVFQRL